MRLLYGHANDIAHWVACRIPLMAQVVASNPPGEAFGACNAIGVVDEQGTVVGGVIYHNWQPVFRTIDLSFAADTPRWLTPALVRALLSYPFSELACQRVTTLTPKRNRRARAFLERFGFKREGCVKRGFGADDAIISGLLVEEWEAHRFNRPRVASSDLEAPPIQSPRLPQAPAQGPF